MRVFAKITRAGLDIYRQDTRSGRDVSITCKRNKEIRSRHEYDGDFPRGCGGLFCILLYFLSFFLSFLLSSAPESRCSPPHKQTHTRRWRPDPLPSHVVWRSHPANGSQSPASAVAQTALSIVNARARGPGIPPLPESQLDRGLNSDPGYFPTPSHLILAKSTLMPCHALLPCTPHALSPCIPHISSPRIVGPSSGNKYNFNF